MMIIMVDFNINNNNEDYNISLVKILLIIISSITIFFLVTENTGFRSVVLFLRITNPYKIPDNIKYGPHFLGMFTKVQLCMQCV